MWWLKLWGISCLWPCIEFEVKWRTNDSFLIEPLFCSIAMKLLSEKRAQIVALAESGMKQTCIASQLNVSQPVVSWTLRLHREMESFASRSRSWRPICTTAQTDRLIHRFALNKPRIMSSQVALGLPRSTQVSCSTIRRLISRSFGLKADRPAKKPYLSTNHVRDHLLFCKNYESWTSDQ